MKIKIENYKNIISLDLEIKDEKINYLCGNSGSGKTSIAEGLLGIDFENNFAIGKTREDIKVTINGSEVSDNHVETIRCYNTETQDKLLTFDKQLSDDFYRIIFNDTRELDKLQNDLSNKIKDYENQKKHIILYQAEIDKLKKDFTGKLNKDGTLSKSAKIGKYHDELVQIEGIQSAKDTLRSMNANELDWKIKGKNINQNYKNEECPFCNQSLEQVTIDLIDNLSKITPKNFSTIIDTKLDFNLMKINEPVDKLDASAIETFKGEIIKALIVSEELIKIEKAFDDIKKLNANPSDIKEIEYDDDISRVFPELKNIIEAINKDIYTIKQLLGKNKEVFDELVGGNITNINKYLKKFGILYQFKLSDHDYENKEASYILYHNNDKKEQHRVSGLSFGEKNMISLLLFMSIPDGELLIIDDPASSYDDYRRKTILDLIYQEANKRTVLILSHDHVFIKSALIQNNRANQKSLMNKDLSKLENKYLDYTGSIYFLENFESKAVLKNILIGDFSTAEKHIKEHYKSIEGNASYYRKIINLRLLAELKKYDKEENDELVYGFLSTALRKEPKSTIIDELSKNNKTEEEVIGLIKEKFDIELPSMPDNYNKNIDLSDFTEFELAIAKRGLNLEQNEIDELNNIVHFNNSLTIQLNPYKFNSYSIFVHSVINKA